MPSKETSHMPLTRLDLEHRFGAGSPRLHCPACGVETIGQTGFTACAHLLFVFVGMAGLFDSIDPELEAWIGRETERRVVEGELELSPLELAYELLDASPAKGLLAISLTTGGMACVPVWETNWAAYSLLRESCCSTAGAE